MLVVNESHRLTKFSVVSDALSFWAMDDERSVVHTVDILHTLEQVDNGGSYNFVTWSCEAIYYIHLRQQFLLYFKGTNDFF